MPRREQDKPDGPRGYPNYSRVSVAGLKKSRKGKHHKILLAIMEDFRSCGPDFAVKIPLGSTDGVSVLNLRSAIIRAAAKENISVETSSDDEHFYVWKRKTAR